MSSENYLQEIEEKTAFRQTYISTRDGRDEIKRQTKVKMDKQHVRDQRKYEGKQMERESQK